MHRFGEETWGSWAWRVLDRGEECQVPRGGSSAALQLQVPGREQHVGPTEPWDLSDLVWHWELVLFFVYTHNLKKKKKKSRTLN